MAFILIHNVESKGNCIKSIVKMLSHEDKDVMKMAFDLTLTNQVKDKWC